MTKKRRELEEIISKAKESKSYFPVRKCFVQLAPDPYEFLLIAQLLDGRQIVLKFPVDEGLANLEFWVKETSDQWYMMLEDRVLPHQREIDEEKRKEK